MTVFINRGDMPMTDAQVNKRTQSIIDRDWPGWKRERAMRTDPTDLNAYMDAWSLDADENRAINTFNRHLVSFRAATRRLDQYVLADGRAEEVFTGEDGVEYTVPAIKPLPADVEQTTVDEDGVETTVMVKNPLIVMDENERKAANAIVGATPNSVKAFADENPL